MIRVLFCSLSLMVDLSLLLKFFSRKKTAVKFWESSCAVCCRLFDSDRKIPNVKNERQMIVIEKKFLERNCHRLFRISFKK